MWTLRMMSYLYITWVEMMVRRNRIHAAMTFSELPLRRHLAEPQAAAETKRIFEAVDWALTRHFCSVKCWHRAFVSARLLREAGIDAEVRIGVTTGPFSAHAWVEVQGVPFGLDETGKLTYVRVEGFEP